MIGRRRKWHERWLDYRLLAEILRHQRLIAPLGGIRASPSVPEHWTRYGDPGASWMAWYARAIERSIGLPNAVVDGNYLQACLDDLHGQLGGPYGQVGFHETTAARSERIEHRLHIAEFTLFSLTLLCCLFHITHGQLHWPNVNPHWLTFFCGFFPALGAAFAGISNQAEFRRVTLRSESMHEGLTQQQTQVEKLRTKMPIDQDQISELTSSLTEVAGSSATMMVNEVLDWRVIFQDRPLKTV